MKTSNFYEKITENFIFWSKNGQYYTFKSTLLGLETNSYQLSTKKTMVNMVTNYHVSYHSYH